MICLHLWSLCPTSRLDDLDFCLIVAVWLDEDTGEVVVARPCQGGGCEEVLEGLQRETDLEFVTEPKIREANFAIIFFGIEHHYSIVLSNPDASVRPRFQREVLKRVFSDPNIIIPSCRPIMTREYGLKNGLYQAPKFSPFGEFKRRYRPEFCPASGNEGLKGRRRRDLSISSMYEAQYDKDEKDEPRMSPVAAPTPADRLARNYPI